MTYIITITDNLVEHFLCSTFILLYLFSMLTMAKRDTKLKISFRKFHLARFYGLV